MSVLIVDDDPAIASLLAEMVTLAGATVWASVGSGEAALDALERVVIHSGDVATPGPDLVLLDVQLPGIDGVETSRRVHTMHPGLDVVLISSLSESDLPADALAGGVLAFVPKSELGPERIGTLLSATGGATGRSPR